MQAKNLIIINYFIRLVISSQFFLKAKMLLQTWTWICNQYYRAEDMGENVTAFDSEIFAILFKVFMLRIFF